MNHMVPDEHLKSIGDITVSFALLESQIQSVVGSMLNEKQRIGQIITAELSFKNLRALLISLFIERHGKEDSDYAALKELMNRSAEVEGKRNQITHSLWASGGNSDTITRIKTTAKEKHGVRFHFEQVSSESLDDFASEIKALAKEIMDFWIELLTKGKAINNHTKQQLN